MITIGIDCGVQNTKAVAMEKDKVRAKAVCRTEFNVEEAVENVVESVLKAIGKTEDDVEKFVITGSGKDLVSQKYEEVSEIIAAAKGTYYIKPDSRLVIDIGGESCRVIKLHEGTGAVETYEVNDKCASGAGIFIETMARTLGVSVEEMGTSAMKHKKELTMNARCVVFVESEVISMIHQQESVEDIAYGVLGGVANRIAFIVKQVGKTAPVTIVGGPAKNTALVDCLEKEIREEIFAPEDSIFVCAIGAAIYGKTMAQRKDK